MKKYILLMMIIAGVLHHLSPTSLITIAQEPPTPDVTPETTPVIRKTIQGSVSGTVTIGTGGLVLPSDAQISLHIVDAISQTETIQTTTISTENRYLFQDVPITDGDFYFVLMSVNGRNFASNPVEGDIRFPNLDLPITVYDVITDPSVIIIENMVVQIRPTQGVLGFTQVVQVRNQSNRLYIGGIPTVNDLTATFELTLPVGALVTETLVMLNNEIAPMRPSSFVVDNSTFKVQYTEAIFPDLDYLFVINYLMPYEQDAVMEFPVWHRFDGDMRLLIGTDELQVIGDNIESLGAQAVGEIEFLAYGASYDLFPNDTIRYELRGRVAGVGEFANTNTAPQNTISLSDNLPLLLLIGVVGMLVIFLGTTLMSGRRKSKLLPIESEMRDEDAS